MTESDKEGERKRDQFQEFLYALFPSFGVCPNVDLPRALPRMPQRDAPIGSVLIASYRQKNLTKGELALKHAVGLGPVPNAVPMADPVLDGPSRAVEVGWHPVGGLAGKWFAEETGLGKMITERINKYPDPTQHWAVLVGDYAHQALDGEFPGRWGWWAIVLALLTQTSVSG